jgi:hypothetical protein
MSTWCEAFFETLGAWESPGRRPDASFVDLDLSFDQSYLWFAIEVPYLFFPPSLVFLPLPPIFFRKASICFWRAL